MKEYIAARRFHSGELNAYVEKDERIGFDGVRANFRGEVKAAPQLMSAIRAGFLTVAAVTASGKASKDDPSVEETPTEKAARMKKERLSQIRGSAGNGEFLEDVSNAQQAKRLAKSRNETALKSQEPAPRPPEKAPKTKLPVHTESEGTVVAKVKTGGTIAEGDTDKRTFYDALLDNQRKKLSIDKDQFVPPKRQVVVKENQQDAVEIKKLSDSIGESAEIAIAENPIKAWNSLTVRKKEAFLKKANDSTVIKKIIEQEKGAVKKKAEERLQELNEQGSTSVV